MAAMFYVYRLIDPRDGQAFYIGKGKGARIVGHEAEARRGVHSAKCSRIREIWVAGLTVKREKLSEHECGNEALQAEFELIAEIGLDRLTNVLPGGVMGQRVYLERLAAAEARRADRERLALEAGLVTLAPKMANFLKHRALGRDYGAWAGTRWIDFTDGLMSFLRDMIKAVGRERANAIFAPYGVEFAA